jgi:hypothetical protein
VKWLTRVTIIMVVVSGLSIVGGLAYLIDYVRDATVQQAEERERSTEAIIEAQSGSTRDLVRRLDRQQSRGDERFRSAIRRDLQLLFVALGGEGPLTFMTAEEADEPPGADRSKPGQRPNPSPKPTPTNKPTPKPDCAVVVVGQCVEDPLE